MKKICTKNKIEYTKSQVKYFSDLFFFSFSLYECVSNRKRKSLIKFSLCIVVFTANLLFYERGDDDDDAAAVVVVVLARIPLFHSLNWTFSLYEYLISKMPEKYWRTREFNVYLLSLYFGFCWISFHCILSISLILILILICVFLSFFLFEFSSLSITMMVIL